MKKRSRFIKSALILMLFSGLLMGQNSATPTVTITPEHAVIEPGEGLQLEAHLFTADGKAVNDFDGFSWRVKPDSLAKVNQDGFLQAGRERGTVIVVASFKRGNVFYYGKATIEIGKQAAPPVKIIVTPGDAFVQPDSSKKFHVVAVSPDNRNFLVEHIRWIVNPKDLGKIDQNGLFTAGSNRGQGTVTAYVDIGGAVYRGVAKVTVNFPPTGSISGSVKDEMTGEALTNARITVTRLGTIHWVRTVETDQNGHYQAGRLIPGLYVVKAVARDYLAEYYDNADHLAEALPVQVDVESEVTGVDFQLGHGSTINGIVFTDDSTTVLPGTLITAIRKTTNTKRFAIADSVGEFSLRSLPQGAWAVLATTTGYYPEYYDDARSMVDAELIHVTPPDTTNGIDFYLATTTAITGVVLAEDDGQAIPGSLISVYQKTATTAGWRYFRSTTTDAQGQYIVSVPAGVYIVHAGARGFAGEYFDDAQDVSEADDVIVLEDQHTTDIDFKLARLGSLSGGVMDQVTGKPISNAAIYAFMEYENSKALDRIPVERRYFKTQSDSTGAYRFDALPTGKFYLQARANGYLIEFWQEVATLDDATPVAVEVGSEIVDINFTLSSGATISGKVFDAEDSTALAGASVTIWSNTTGVKKRVYTDREGNYILSGLPSGEYFAYANQKGYDGKFYDGVDDPAEATAIRVKENATVSGVDFYLPQFVTALGTISGVVTEEPDTLSEQAPTPIGGAFVIAIPTTGGPSHFDVTDPFGNYRITRLLRGNYIVFSWAPGHTGEFFDNVQNWQRATRIMIVEDAEVENINFALAETEQGPYTIRGRIHAGEGQQKRQIVNAIVFAIGERGMVAGITDAEGRFAISDLPAGNYKILVEGAGIQSSYLGGTNENDAQTLALEDGVALDIGEMAVQATTTTVGDNAEVPSEFLLHQNYPNPFNPETTVKFTLAKNGKTVVQVFNILGQHVKTLVDQNLEAGTHTVHWQGIDSFGRIVSSGLYVLQLRSSGQAATIRMVLLK